MIVKELTELEFKEFTDRYPYSSIFQTVECAKIMQEEGYKIMYIGAIESGDLVATSLLMIQNVKGYNYAFAPRGFLIDYSNTELLNTFTREVKKFLGKKNVMAVKLCPIILKNLYNDKGQVIGTNKAFNQIFDNLKSLGYYHYGFNSYFEAMKPRFEAIIDLTKDYRVLFKNIKKEYKTKIRTAEEKGIKIYRADQNELSYLYTQLGNKNKRNFKFIENSYKYFSQSDKMDFYYAKLDTEVYLRNIKKRYEKQEAYCSNINHSVLKRRESSKKMISKKLDADRQLGVYKNQLIEATKLIRDYPTGIILSCVLVAKHRNEVYLYMDSFDRKYKQFNSKHLILWKVIEKYAYNGYKRFNLGAVSDITIKNNPYKGLNMFKTNFNASIIEYIGDFELVTHKAKYFLYKQMVKQKDQLK